MAKGMTYQEAFEKAIEQFKFLEKYADGGRAGYMVGGMTKLNKQLKLFKNHQHKI